MSHPFMRKTWSAMSVKCWENPLSSTVKREKRKRRWSPTLRPTTLNQQEERERAKEMVQSDIVCDSESFLKDLY